MTTRLPDHLERQLADEAARRGVTVESLVADWLSRDSDTAVKPEQRDIYALTDANPDLIARFDRSLRYSYVNPASVTLLTRPIEEIIGATFYEMPIPRDLADQLTDDLRRAFASGKEQWTQWVISGPRRRLFFETQIIPLFGADGEVESVMTVSREVTARIMAEEALRDSERRYRSIVEGQLDLVCLIEPDSTLAYVNKAYCAFYGRPPEELIGKSFFSLVRPEDLQRVKDRLAELQRDPTPRTMEFLTPDEYGNGRWIQWVDYGITDEDGTLQLVQSIGRDITHIKRVEQALIDERHRYEELFELTPQPLYIYDEDTLAFLKVNDSMVRNYGYSHEEFAQMNLLDIRSPNEANRLVALLRGDARDQEVMTSSTWVHRRKDGSTFEVEVSARRIRFDGRPARLVVAADMTERRALEAERMNVESLEIELTKEREITLLKERFTQMVTHEFRTPLSVIVSTIDILKSYIDRLSKDDIGRKLDIVTNEARRMSKLLDDVLSISRASAGRVSVMPESFDALDVLRGVVENLSMADHGRHTFVINPVCSAAPLTTDRRLFEQVLINLLTNAVKYSPSGTTVSAEICADADHITLRISDQGIGIPEDEQHRIFDAFHRADNASGIEGTGLGLAIVKQSVTQLGGDIDFISAVGSGTTFTVNLPVEPVARA
ncbi:MAG: PAS domain S-box protein [Chloroflexi bacterium]|nr:PAS domain S-box protein [Chloroflexota bacterium]